MENRFELLTCNDDVISFQEHTFKIGKFREQLSKEFHLRENRNGGEISQFCYMSISGMQIPLGEINWKSSIIDCELLRLGSQSWQKGKCRLQVHIRILRNEQERKQLLVQPDVEFCPDEPPISEPESPLDDLRQMINQQTQQSNG